MNRCDPLVRGIGADRRRLRPIMDGRIPPGSIDLPVHHDFIIEYHVLDARKDALAQRFELAFRYAEPPLLAMRRKWPLSISI